MPHNRFFGDFRVVWQGGVPHKIVIAVKHGCVATVNSAKPQKNAILEISSDVASNSAVPHNAKNGDFRVVWHGLT